MTSTTTRIIFAVAAVAGQLLFVGTQSAEAIDTQTGMPPKHAPAPGPAPIPSPAHGKRPDPIIRDHRANPTPYSLPQHYHNHHAGQGRGRR